MKRKFYIYKNGNYYEDSVLGSVDVTYAQIKTLRDGGTLTPGAFYRITDYECMTATDNTSSAGHQFDIIVLALENNKLSEEAWAAHHTGDTYFANSKLEAWQLWYCIDNDTDRFAWARVPEEEHLVYKNSHYYREPQYDGVKGNYCWSNLTAWYLFTDTLDSPTTASYWQYIGGSWNSWGSANVQYVPATSATGKGVIYRMIDEFDNDVPYDFKNILFTSSGKYTNAYTFSYTESSTIKDASLLGSSKSCYSNVMKSRSKTKQPLNFNVFYSTSTSFSCYSNTFEDGCYSNTFGEGSYFNTFGQYCHSNTFGRRLRQNTFGSECGGNTLGVECWYNTFGPDCVNNSLGDACRHNTFGPGCVRNRLGGTCMANSFGNFCKYNIFGSHCDNITFGDGCSSITFGTSLSSTINYCRDIVLDNGCGSLYIDSTDTSEGGNNCLQNIHIHSGVSGKTITVPDRNLAYSTDYYANGSQTVILD